MQKNSIKNIAKLSSAIGLVYVLLFLLFICLPFITKTKAETVDFLPSCTDQKCFSNLSDLAVSSDGSFSLILDSGTTPLIKKVDISSGKVTGATIIPLGDNNVNKVSLRLSISKDDTKALIYSISQEKSSSSSSSGEDIFARFGDFEFQNKQSNLLGQVDQGTDCKCGTGTFFDGTLCINGTLTCTDLTSDPICSCDSLTFLNSCVARANGVKKFTKGECGGASNLSCTADSQCPLGNCPNGTTFKRFTCTTSMCTLAIFSADPCISTTAGDCKCLAGTYFDEMACVSGTLDCTGVVTDAVCSCDNLNFLNSCIARANGAKKYTKGDCGSESGLNCAIDSQCPVGVCPGGKTYNKFTCAGGKCTKVAFSVDPCLTVTSVDCRCPSGTFFDGKNCVKGTLSCTNIITDPVCSCDSRDFLNSCIAKANGIKTFTKGGCGSESGLNCSLDKQCPAGVCPNGKVYKNFTCMNGICESITFSVDPCSSSSSSGGFSNSIIRIINLADNSIKTITPTLKTKSQSVSVVSFLDVNGEELVANNNDEDSPRFFVINSQTGKVEKAFESPGIAKSIELSPNFRKAVVTFKDDLAQSIGILIAKAKDLVKFDIPTGIIFKIDEFLSRVDFNLSGTVSVASSLAGRHVLHLLDLINSKLTIKFLSKDIEGQTLSTISPDGTVAVSVGNIENITGENGIVVYKLNVTNPRKPRSIKTVNFTDDSRVLDVLISPDNNKILILIQRENEKRLKILSFEDLSLLCEFKVSADVSGTFLISDPYGRYLLTPNFMLESVSLISDLHLGPVFKSVSPGKGPTKGGTEFAIDGFIDPSVFTGNLKVCFGNRNFCATSIMISSTGRTITGTTPGFPRPSVVDVILIAEKKLNVPASPSSSSGSIQCPKEVSTEAVYKKAFKFE